jgi:hypothetical protein
MALHPAVGLTRQEAHQLMGLIEEVVAALADEARVGLVLALWEVGADLAVRLYTEDAA